MTFTRYLLAAAVAGVISQPSLAGNPTPCTDCPTPPPCSVDGACYPKHRTYGYYRTKWDRWPGDYDEDAAPEGEGTVLPKRLIPQATEEDRAAPPPSQPKQEQVEPGLGEGATEFDLPALPPVPGPAGPAAPTQPQRQPQAPADNNGPPGLPPLPGFGPPPGIGAPPSTGIRHNGVRPQPRPADDAPPPLPSGFASLLSGGSGVRQTSHRSEASPSDSLRVQQVSPAYYRSTDK